MNPFAQILFLLFFLLLHPFKFCFSFLLFILSFVILIVFFSSHFWWFLLLMKCEMRLQSLSLSLVQVKKGGR